MNIREDTMANTDERGDLPDPEENPIEAAEEMLERTRTAMSGELYENHEEVRDWAMNLEWALTALWRHEVLEQEGK